MERFDAAIDPPPDLLVEVDGTRRVIPRLPIYAALGVPEVWRWSKGKLHILGLEHGQYTPLTRSRALPMIEPDALQIWVDRLATAENVSLVFRDFRAWCRTLPR
jgi:Uma2 family endonuclease